MLIRSKRTDDKDVIHPDMRVRVSCLVCFETDIITYREHYSRIVPKDRIMLFTLMEMEEGIQTALVRGISG